MAKQKDDSVQRMMVSIVTRLTGQANILTIPRLYVDLTGSLEAGLFLSQCLYWTDKSTVYSDGWFFKSFSEWQKEIGLSKYHVQQAAGLLESRGWLEIDVDYVSGRPTRHYRMILDKLLHDLEAIVTSPKPKPKPDDPDEPAPEPPAAGLTDVGIPGLGEILPGLGENLPVDNSQNGVGLGENLPGLGENLPGLGENLPGTRRKFTRSRQKIANVTETTPDTTSDSTSDISSEITLCADGAPAPESNLVSIPEPEPEPELEPALVMFEKAAGRPATPSEQYRISIAGICNESRLGRWQRVLSGTSKLETEDDTWKVLGQVKLAIYQMERR